MLTRIINFPISISPLIIGNMYNTFSDDTSNEMLDTMFNDGLAANNRLNINNRLNTGNTELSAGHRYKRYIPAGQSSQMNYWCYQRDGLPACYDSTEFI